MLQGLSHLTLSVADLPRSIGFYQDVLGLRLRAAWQHGAYLQAGQLWLCLAQAHDRAVQVAANYTRDAFSISAGDFPLLVERLRSQGVASWQEKRSEGDSFCFLDPDGHRLELHVGDLASRLRHCRQQPYRQMQFHD